MRISDWSSDVCSSDLLLDSAGVDQPGPARRDRLRLSMGFEHRLSFRDDYARGQRPRAVRIDGRLARSPERERGGGYSATGDRRGDGEGRSEARSVGKGWGSTGRSRWSRCRYKKKQDV